MMQDKKDETAITDKQEIMFMELLIRYDLSREDVIAISTFLDTPEKILKLLDVMAENNYKMSPQEILNATGKILEAYPTEE